MSRATREAGSHRVRRPDASMSLLSDLQTHSMDGGYAAAARRRAGGRHVRTDDGRDGGRLNGRVNGRDDAMARGRARRGRARHPGRLASTALAATALLGLLVTTAVLDVRERQRSTGRSELIREVQERTAAAAEQQASLEQLRAELRTLRNDQLAMTATDSAGAARLERLGIIAGEIPARGPGVEVVLNDARPQSGLDRVQSNDPRARDGLDDSRVRDIDLQVTVNGLWVAGAEAVTVNGQRLTALTSIRAAGAAILVDYQPLAPPYVVQAIGDPGELESGFADGFAGRWLASAAENVGLRYAVSQQEQLTLPGAASITLRHARPGAPTPPPAPAGAP